MPTEKISLSHVFIDHSNVWGGARLASRIKNPKLSNQQARIRVSILDSAIQGSRRGINTKIVCGGIPPGMEGLWAEYRNHGYDTQRLFRDENWKERGVDHVIIGHIWRLIAIKADAPSTLVLVSGDGKQNEFGSSFREIIIELLSKNKYPNWNVELASFFWKTPEDSTIHCPTSTRMRQIVETSPRGKFVNLMDHYAKLVYHEPI